MSRLIVGLLALLVASPASAAADDFPYGDSIVFFAVRNGEKIGQQTVAFRHDGPQLTVTTSVDLAAKIIGLTVYRYSLRSQEVWTGDVFQSLAAQTNDDGKVFFVRAQHSGDAVVVEHDAAGTMRETMPGSVIPASHWNIRQVGQSILLHTQLGTQAKVHVTPLGRETIKTATGGVNATHYRYEGDIVLDQWFDDKGRWVKMSFKVSDGSTIDYVLQN